MKFHAWRKARTHKQAVRSHSYRSAGSARPDYWMVAIIVIMALFGILMVYDSSIAMALRDFSDRYYFVKEQVKWLAMGFAGMFIASRIDYRLWKHLAFPMLLGTLFLLVVVFIPGLGVRAYGASRWINFRILVIQPAELAKFALIVYLSAWFTSKERDRFMSFLLLLGMVVGLVLLEPDLGTALVLVSTSVILYFVSGAPVKHFALIVPGLVFGVMLLTILSPYRMKRLTTFINPEADPMKSSYHIRQAILALGSGGVFGMGLGKSRQKYEYLPEANTDSIFAIIGEETGMVGCLLLITFILMLVWRGFRIARRVQDPFGRLVALGISTWIGVQSMINIAAMVALVPLTGIPLPLISYGGSSLVVLLSSLGVLLNISREAAND